MQEEAGAVVVVEAEEGEPRSLAQLHERQAVLPLEVGEGEEAERKKFLVRSA